MVALISCEVKRSSFYLLQPIVIVVVHKPNKIRWRKIWRIRMVEWIEGVLRLCCVSYARLCSHPCLLHPCMHDWLEGKPSGSTVGGIRIILWFGKGKTWHQMSDWGWQCSETSREHNINCWVVKSGLSICWFNLLTWFGKVALWFWPDSICWPG